MQKFKITLQSEPGKVQANDLKVLLRDYFMDKIKSEGLDLKVWPIQIEEMIDGKENVPVNKKDKKTKNKG